MTPRKTRSATHEPTDLEHVRGWIEDTRAVLCVLALVPRDAPPIQRAAADQAAALRLVLDDLSNLQRQDTAAAVDAASAMQSGAQILLTLATGAGDVAEPGDGAWWSGHAMWLIGKAQEHLMTAHAHARRPGRKPGTAPTRARIEKVLAERQSVDHRPLSDKEVADAAFSSTEYVRKVRGRRT